MVVFDTFRKELRECLRLRPSVLFLETFDYLSVSDEFYQAFKDEQLQELFPVIAEWSPGYGRSIFRNTIHQSQGGALEATLRDFIAQRKPQLLILKNVHTYLLQDDVIASLLQTFVFLNEKRVPEKRSMIVVMDAIYQLPPALDKLFFRLPFPYPDKEDIKAELLSGKYELKGRLKTSEAKQLQCVNALVGMQLYEIRSLLKTTMEKNGCIEYYDTHQFAEYKEQIVKNSGVLEVISNTGPVEPIGGLEELKKYLARKKVLQEKSIERKRYNIPAPKGILLVGSPGCGKTMSAKAVARIFQIPLLRLDMGKLMGPYVGESEHNLSKAIAVAEAAQPCVLWIDEIEKAFAGASAKGGNSDITVRRMVGSFLTWLQERKSEVYVTATANSLEQLPPELLRKGRLDNTFYVTYPDPEERKDIFKLCLQKHSFLNIQDNELIEVAGKEEVSFSGAEINAIVQTAAEEYLVKKQAGTTTTIISIIREMLDDSRYQLTDKVLTERKKEIQELKEGDFLPASKTV